jgi:hypothetical protein
MVSLPAITEVLWRGVKTGHVFLTFYENRFREILVPYLLVSEKGRCYTGAR